MRVLVTGATGFVGRALVLRLQRDRHAVSAWVRDPEKARHALGPDVALRPAGGPDAWREALVGADGVVNLAGEPLFGRRWTAVRRQALVESRVGLTTQLADALGALPADTRPRVLVSASAVGWYGDRGDETLTEASAPGEGFLADLCRAWVEAARRAEAAGARVVLPRIGIVLGPEGGALQAMLPAFRWGLGGPLGSGLQHVPWIHLADLVEAMATALTDDRYRGPVNAVAPDPVPQGTFARAVGRAIRRPAFFPVPGPILRLAVGGAASAVLSSQCATPRRLIDLGFRFRFAGLDAALDDVLGAPGRVAIIPAKDAPASDYLVQRQPRYLLRARTVVPAPLNAVFAFFSAAGNLGLLTPPAMRFRILTPEPIPMAAGAEIAYAFRVGPVTIRWKTVIARWEAGRLFADAQAEGPYRSWWHEHRFEAEGAGATVMEDRVWYAPPLGALGRMAHPFLVAPQLRRIFAYRAAAIRLRFGSGTPRSGSLP